MFPIYFCSQYHPEKISKTERNNQQPSVEAEIIGAQKLKIGCKKSKKVVKP